MTQYTLLMKHVELRLLDLILLVVRSHQEFHLLDWNTSLLSQLQLNCNWYKKSTAVVTIYSRISKYLQTAQAEPPWG